MSGPPGRMLLISLALSLAACAPQGPAGPTPVSTEARRLVAELGPAYSAADLDNGRLRFNLCRSCHLISAGGLNAVGPNLYGVFGRRVASAPAFSYSQALRAQAFAWDAAHLDVWLTNPRAYVPGTKMSFVGLKDATDRRDLIAYLKVASSGGGT